MNPLKNNVIIELPGSQEQTSTSGLVLVGASDVKDRGVVIGVGPDVDCVEVGDMVIFNTNAPHSVMEPEPKRKMVVIDSDHLLAVLEEDA